MGRMEQSEKGKKPGLFAPIVRRRRGITNLGSWTRDACMYMGTDLGLGAVRYTCEILIYIYIYISLERGARAQEKKKRKAREREKKRLRFLLQFLECARIIIISISDNNQKRFPYRCRRKQASSADT